MLFKRKIRVFTVIICIIIFTIPTYADVNVMYDLATGAKLYNALRSSRITATSYFYDYSVQDTERYNSSEVVTLNGGKLNIRLYVPTTLVTNNDTETIGLEIPLNFQIPTEGFYKQVVLSNVDVYIPLNSLISSIGIQWRLNDGTSLKTYIYGIDFPTPPVDADTKRYQKISSLFFDVPTGATRMISLEFNVQGNDTFFNDYYLSIDNNEFYIEFYGFCYTTYDGYDPLKQQISNNVDDLVNFTPTPETPEFNINPEEGEIFENLGSSVGDFNFDFAPNDVTFLQSGEIFRTIYEGLNEMNGFAIFMGFACLCCVLKVVIT